MQITCHVREWTSPFIYKRFKIIATMGRTMNAKYIISKGVLFGHYLEIYVAIFM